MTNLHPEELGAESIQLRLEYWDAVREPDRNTSIEQRWGKALELKRQFIRSLKE
ncbi:MAG: hypothetical protein IIB77_03260 [Proteobacteria bacterium]|nr:hypothetical protein [Pseudomonadota bacterium]